MILVDTSVWIDFFDHRDSPYANELVRLIKEDEELCLADMNVVEILQGIKEERVFEEIKGYLMQFPILRARSLETYIRAAHIYRLCRKIGKTITKTMDAIIAAIALENNFRVFHRDKDFDLIADCTKLKIYSFDYNIQP